MKVYFLLLLFIPISLFAQNNVGIGTNTPLSKLDIQSVGDGAELLRLSTDRPWVFKQRASGSSTRLTLQTTVNSKHFDILSEDGLHLAAEFFLNNEYSYVMLVPDGGEVGIGVSDALGKLHISQNSTTTFPQLRLTEEGEDFARIKFENDANAGAFWDIAGKADTVTNDARLNFYFANGLNNGDRMTITGIGNVGIGESNPNNKLRVVGLSSSTAHIISASATYSGNSNIRAIEGFSTPATGYGIGGYFYGGARGLQSTAQGNSSTGLSIGVEASAYGTAGTRTGLFARASGGTTNWAGFFAEGDVYITNVLGIGNETPEAKLDILGGDWNLDAGNPGDLRIGSSPANAFRIGVATGGGGAGTTRLYAQGGSLLLGTNNTARMTITTGGNVGIGETNPGNKVRIVGNNASTNHVLSVSSAYAGNSNIRAVEGFATPAVGYGFGGYFYGGARGVQAIAQGTSSGGLCIGVEASAYGTTGTRTGIFARASGGATNWAGYFAEGNVYVTNELRIGSGAIGGATGYKVAIDGKVIAEELRIKLSQDWPDYVFAKDYPLMPLEELAENISHHHHLPGIPNAAEVEENGILIGDMQKKMMQKIEELTLYIIDLDQQNKELRKRINHIENNMTIPAK